MAILEVILKNISFLISLSPFFSNPSLHCVFFWIGIVVMQLQEKQLFAAGLGLVEHTLHQLDALDAFATQVGYGLLLPFFILGQKFSLEYAPAALLDADFGPVGAGQFCLISIRIYHRS